MLDLPFASRTSPVATPCVGRGQAASALNLAPAIRDGHPQRPRPRAPVCNFVATLCNHFSAYQLIERRRNRAIGSRFGGRAVSCPRGLSPFRTCPLAKSVHGDEHSAFSDRMER